MRYFIALTVFLFFGNSANAQQQVVTVHTKSFPFSFNETSARWDLLINLRDSDIIKKYKPLFTQYKLPFEGDIMEEVLIQIIDKIDPGLNAYLTYMDGEGVIYICTSGNKAIQKNYIEDMQLVFSDMEILERLLKKLNRLKIDPQD